MCSSSTQPSSRDPLGKWMLFLNSRVEIRFANQLPHYLKCVKRASARERGVATAVVNAGSALFLVEISEVLCICQLSYNSQRSSFILSKSQSQQTRRAARCFASFKNSREFRYMESSFSVAVLKVSKQLSKFCSRVSQIRAASSVPFPT